MMVDRELSDLYADNVEKTSIGEEYFSVKNLSATGQFKDISFGLKRGEILGFAGLIGCGRTEMACGIIGLEKLSSGEIYVDGQKKDIRSVQDAMEAGIGYITEDRKGQGLFINYTLSENIVAPSLKDFSKYGIMQKTEIEEQALELIKKFNIITPSTKQIMLNLSGGNQQKCLLSMWMNKAPSMLIFDEPTRGVDVGAKSEIYEKIREYVSEGNGAIVISSELPELLGLCDRIIVMYQGRIQVELLKKDFSEETIILYASGLKKEIN